MFELRPEVPGGGKSEGKGGALPWWKELVEYIKKKGCEATVSGAQGLVGKVQRRVGKGQIF